MQYGAFKGFIGIVEAKIEQNIRILKNRIKIRCVGFYLKYCSYVDKSILWQTHSVSQLKRREKTGGAEIF